MISPKNTNKITDSQKKCKEVRNDYIERNCKVIAKLPKIIGKLGQVKRCNKFSAYFTPIQNNRPQDYSICESNLQDVCFEMAELIEHGINLMRVEASEILAFVITDSERICNPGIPPHLPITYGLRGHSLPMEIMLKMLNDIRNELKKVDANILCEVYDGQFHSIIVKAANGKPLTRLQHMQNYFKEVMINYDRDELISKLLVNSDISEEDVKDLYQTKFKNGVTKHMNSITLEMKKVMKKVNREKIIIRRMYIRTKPIDNTCMQDIRTKHREHIWMKFLKQKFDSNKQQRISDLSSRELQKMMEGTKVHRRIASRKVMDNISEITDTESDDSDYRPEEESVISESESDVEVNEFSLQNISNISTTSTGESCIKRILEKLKQRINKHNWRNESLDSFVQKYLSSKKGINKLFNYELDVINEEIEREFGKNIFHKNDKKLVRVNKLFVQLRKMPHLLKFETSDEENIVYYQPKTLFEIYREFLLSRKYPKEYLVAPICDIGHLRSIKEWEEDSPSGNQLANTIFRR